VLSDILKAVDSGDVAGLVLLGLSAAFDIVDHDILLRRLNTSYGLNGTAIQWFCSYLTGRSQYVRRGSVKSSIVRLICGVPQGSVLGPVLFVLYTADLIRLIERHSLHPHIYADDTQVYESCSPADVRQLQSRVSSSVDDIASWMQSNRLKLKTDKTEVLWCATSRRQHQLPTTPTKIGNDLITSSTSVRNFSVYLDADLSMRSHVHNTVSKCFAMLRQLRNIHRSVPASAYQTLILSLVLTKLDYGNTVLSGLSAHLIRRLQSVMNAAARSIAGLRHAEHTTNMLAGFN
jgi:ribonuclease P/MRP protein subunit RPP40